MKRLLLSLILLLALTSNASMCAGDFPGVGDPNGWSDALPYYNMGNKYMSQERFGEAAQKFQEAVDRYPHDPDFYVNLGVALRKIEDFVAAEQAFKAALKLNDKDWMSWSNLGNAYLKQDRLKDTISAFERAMKCNPPAAEKAAMIRDIADIHKILRARGQEPLPQVGKAKAGSITVSKAGADQRSALPAKKAGQSVANKTGAPQSRVPVTPKGAPGKDWGYE